MNKYTEFLLDLLAQFGGGRGEMENELVRFGVASTLWTGLLIISYIRWQQNPLREEKFLIYGFGIGLIREMFMFTVFSIVLLKISSFESWHIFFPPFEHSLSMAAVIIIAGAYWRFLLKDIILSRRYIRIGIGITIFCYLSTFWWWGQYSMSYPSIKFGQTWADWIFRICTIILLIFPIVSIAKKKLLISKPVLLSLGFFLLDEILMIFNLASGDIHKKIFGPIRHNLHLIAIFILSFVYIKILSIERKSALEKIKEKNEISSSLVQTFNILNADLDIKGIIKNVIKLAPKYLKFDKLIIFLYGGKSSEIIFSNSFGFNYQEERLLEKSFKINNPDISSEKYPIIIDDKNKYNLFSKDFSDALDIQNAVLIPISIEKHLFAIIIGGYNGNRLISSHDILFLKGLSDAIAIVMKNAISIESIQHLLTDTITSFALILDTKSAWTRGHAQRVTNYAHAIGIKIGLDENELKNLYLGGLLHDIGKIGISDTILDKPDKLTKEEFDIVKKHPVQGSLILSAIKQFADILSIVKYHHERYDGEGYPDGKKGAEIPFNARILCVADAYDAMTEDRPYRKALKKEIAIKELKQCSSTQFDPEIVEIFLKILANS